MAKKKTIIIVLAAIVIALAGLLGYTWYRMCKTATPVNVEKPVSNLARLFSDSESIQLQSAKALGLEKPVDRKSHAQRRKYNLVRLKSGKYYDLDLRYSTEFLTEGAATLLGEVARNFADSLAKKDIPSVKLIVTGALRTAEDVAAMQDGGDFSASLNSPYSYGTSFDISWKRFSKKNISDIDLEALKTTLGEVLRDEKALSRCQVKYDEGEGCFRITSLLAR